MSKKHLKYYQMVEAGFLGAENYRKERPSMSKPTKEQFESAARAFDWRFSAAHGGWIHPDEYDRKTGYRVQPSAEAACLFHGITYIGENHP